MNKQRGYTYQIARNSTANERRELKIVSNYFLDSGLMIWACLKLTDVYCQEFKYKPYKLEKNHETNQSYTCTSKTIYYSTTFCP